MMKKKVWLSVIIALIAGLGAAMVTATPAGSPRYESQREQKVAFNTKSLKYHKLSCKWARRCTRNCITITLGDAIRRGGVPCKVCGGS